MVVTASTNINGPTYVSSSPVQSEEENDCSICWDPLNGPAQGNSLLSAVLKKTDCAHWFHEFCLNEWMTKQKTCPNCRASLDQRKICRLVKEATDSVLTGVDRLGSAAWKIAKLGVESLLNTSRCGCYDDIPVASEVIFQ